MHVIILVLTIFFSDPKAPPRTQSVIVPTPEYCVEAAHQLVASGAQNAKVADVEWGCFDVTNKAAKPV